MPKISIIIPVHNTAQYIPQCFESIFAQTFQEFEVVCIDDASTDTSFEVLQAYAEKDARIRIIQFSQNKGSGAARNAGIEIAKGDYVIFCDADDAYPPYSLELLYKRVKDTNSPVSGGNIFCMDQTLQFAQDRGAFFMSLCFYSNACVSPNTFIPLFYPWYHQRYMIKRDFLNEHAIRYPIFLRGQDPPFLAHVFCHAEQVAICPDIVYCYRASASGIQKMTTDKVMKDYFEHFICCAKIYKKHGRLRTLALFLQMSLTMLLGFRFWLPLTFAQRKMLCNTIKELISYEECFSQENFAPFHVCSEEIKKGAVLAMKYPRWYPFLKIVEKVVIRIFRKRA